MKPEQEPSPRGRGALVIATLGTSLTGLLARSVRSAGEVRLAATATGCAEILHSVEALTPKCLLLDMQYLRDDGVDLLDHLLQIAPGLRILVVGTVRGTHDAAALVSHGASGVIARSASTAQFRLAIRKVMAGEIWMSRKLLSRVARRHNHPGAGSATLHWPLDELSDRELKVTDCIARGLSNKQIAIELEIRENTVRTHITNIFRKLKIKRRAELMVGHLEARDVGPGSGRKH